jgi:aspartate kinase
LPDVANVAERTLVVQKYGGTSIGDPDRMRAVADHVARCRRRGMDVTMVVSAMGKETDELLVLADRVSKTQPGREMDMLITAGERKAIALMCLALADLGVPAHSFTGSQAGIKTDTNHRNAKIVEVTPGRVQESLAAGSVPVVAGSQGVSTDNDVTFLGRGGSDTTAVALTKALGADMCELYTDVSGVFSADPRLVPSARKMHAITFDELLEMTATGCPKPAMRSVEVAHNHQVPLHVRSTFTWEPGTLVIADYADLEIAGQELEMERPIIRAVTHDVSESKITVVDVPDKPGVSGTLFRAMADAGVNVDMIVQNVSEHGMTDISFTVPTEDVDRGVATLEDGIAAQLGAKRVTADDSVGRVSVIGAGMKSNPGVAATMFETLAEHDINIEMISTSAIRISCVVNADEAEAAVQYLHTAFGLDAE